jgi:prefoldin subunit 5
MVIVGEFTNYYAKVTKESEELLDQWRNDLKDELELDKVDFDNYFDDKIHDWADSEFVHVDLREAVDIIEGSSYEETDSGLWQGMEPERALETKAFFTFRFDLMEATRESFTSFLEDYFKELESEASDIGYDIDFLKSKVSDLNSEMDALDTTDPANDDKGDEIIYKIQDLEDEIDGFQKDLEKIQDLMDNVDNTMDDL